MTEKKVTIETILKDLKRIKEKTSSDLQSFQQRIYLIQGIALGLFYGIVGNLLVSHYYGVFEGLIKVEYNGMFWANLIVLVIGLALIIVLTIRWHRQLETFKTLHTQLLLSIERLNTLIESYTPRENMKVLKN